MDTVRTGNTRLMRKGDECVFVNNVDMLPQYHITTGKEYPGVIHEVAVDYQIVCNIMNDAGEPATHRVLFDCFSGGMTNANSVLPREEYIKRVNTLHDLNIAKFTEQTRVELNGLIALRDLMLEKANVTPSV